jgi:hypothetical protein
VGVLSHLKLGLSLSLRLVLPLSAARLPGGLKGRLGLGLAYRGLIDGRLDDLCAFGGPLGILLGLLVHLEPSSPTSSPRPVRASLRSWPLSGTPGLQSGLWADPYLAISASITGVSRAGASRRAASICGVCCALSAAHVSGSIAAVSRGSATSSQN